MRLRRACVRKLPRWRRDVTRDRWRTDFFFIVNLKRWLLLNNSCSQKKTTINVSDALKIQITTQWINWRLLFSYSLSGTGECTRARARTHAAPWRLYAVRDPRVLPSAFHMIGKECWEERQQRLLKEDAVHQSCISFILLPSAWHSSTAPEDYLGMKRR